MNRVAGLYDTSVGKKIAMALSVEQHWPADSPLDGLVVTRYQHGLLTNRITVMRHGLTLGEQSHWFVRTLKLNVDFSDANVLGPSSLDFEGVYIILSADYNLFMDTQQRINLALMRELEGMGATFGLPIRKVFMASPVALAQPPEEATARTRAPAAR